MFQVNQCLGRFLNNNRSYFGTRKKLTFANFLLLINTCHFNSTFQKSLFLIHDLLWSLRISLAMSLCPIHFYIFKKVMKSTEEKNKNFIIPKFSLDMFLHVPYSSKYFIVGVCFFSFCFRILMFFLDLIVFEK